jgi:CubicO group peptidase (beta-lactamase class C family)
MTMHTCDAIAIRSYLQVICATLPVRESLFCLSLLSGAMSSSANQTRPGNDVIIKRLNGSTITTQQVDTTVTHIIEEAHVTGACIAIFNSGNVVYMRAYGSRDTNKGLSLTPDSVMSAASLSKAAFVVLVMQLAHEGVLDLDKPVYRYLPKPLPDYPQYADLRGDDRYKMLTMRILLSHTSGFPNWRWFEVDRKLSIHFEPGTRYAYSGEGFALAQFVVETVTGKSLTALMNDRVFVPMGMSRTSMVWESQFEDNFANGYDEYGRSLGPKRSTKPGAAGSMQTTLRDYASFLSAVMQKRFLDGNSTAAMLVPQIAIHSAHDFPSLATETTTANDSIHLSSGLGWALYSTSYGPAFYKGGYDDGWQHLGLCFEKSGNGVLIMTNSSKGTGIFKPLLDSLIGKTSFPFEWEHDTPYTKLPPLPKVK